MKVPKSPEALKELLAVTRGAAKILPPTARTTPEPELEVEFAEVPEGADVDDDVERLDLESALPDAPAEDAVQVVEAESPRRVRRKRRKKSGGWIIPVVALGLMAIFVGGLVFYLNSRTALRGSVTAYADGLPELKPGFVGRQTFKKPEDVVGPALENLSAQPLPLFSQVMELEFSGKEGGVQITVTPGKRTRLVRVPLADAPELLRFLDEHREELERPRQKLIDKSAGEFIELYAEHIKKGGDPRKLVPYRDNLGLASLVGALGFHTVARTGDGTDYLCVYEDEDALYYLIPKKSNVFRIEGRQPPGSEPILRCDYRVTISNEQNPSGGPAAKPAPSQATPPPPTEPPKTEMPVEDDTAEDGEGMKAGT